MSRTVGASFDVISTTSCPRTVTTRGWDFPGDRARPRNAPSAGRSISWTIAIPSRRLRNTGRWRPLVLPHETATAFHHHQVDRRRNPQHAWNAENLRKLAVLIMPDRKYLPDPERRIAMYIPPAFKDDDLDSIRATIRAARRATRV